MPFLQLQSPASRLLPGPTSPSLLLLAARDIGFASACSDRIEVLLDRLWGPVGEDFNNLFPGAAILVPYPKHRYILFRYLPNMLYPRTNYSRIYLGIYTSIIRSYSLCRHLLINIYIQYFEIEVLRDI
jgi:hypothetical protein